MTRQCELLGLNRATYYYQPAPINPATVEMTKKIDEIYTEFPYYGSPRITAALRRQGILINHKAIERLMRLMGIAGICPKKNISKSNDLHTKYPYLLEELLIVRINQVWGTDITYVRANGIWFYLVAIIDWYSRYVIAWKLSETMTSEFCRDALNTALQIAIPEIHNSDQGSQFTSKEYTQILSEKKIQISMDGRGRCFDNIFTERLWRTVKYEEVYLKEYRSFNEAKESLDAYFNSYNTKRLHSALDYQTPAEVYFGKNLIVPEIKISRLEKNELLKV